MKWLRLTASGCVTCGAGAHVRQADGGQSGGAGTSAKAAEPTIGAPVGRRTVARVAQGGNRMADVRKIQMALNRFSPAQGGPYPPLAVDGKVGPKTEFAIGAFQSRWDFNPDGVVDREGITIKRLRMGPYSGPTPAALAVAKLPMVIGMLSIAVMSTQKAIDFRTSFDPLALAGNLLGQAAYAKLIENFLFDDDANLISNMKTVLRILSNMSLAAKRAASTQGMFQDEPPGSTTSALAFSAAGGFWSTPQAFEDSNLINTGHIYFCPLYTFCTPLGQTYIVLHELAHYSAPAFPGVVDYGYYGRSGYEAVPAYRRIVNADTYAQFILNCCGIAHQDFKQLALAQISAA